MHGFIEMLKDLNTSIEQLDKITKTGEILEFSSNNYYKSNSSIHGKGVFASKNLVKRSIIGIGSIDNKYKTTLGRFTNHSDINNARFYYLANNDVILVAEEDIIKDKEILVNYRDHILNKIYLNESTF